MKWRKNGLLLLALLAPLFLFPGAEASGSAVPLSLCASYDAMENTVIVTASTTDTITLANYDMKLDWERDLFSLTAVENCQRTAFPFFLSNLSPSSAGCGQISAVCVNQEAVLPPGEALVSFSFKADAPLGPGRYAFSLTILDAADDAMVRPAWKGESTSCVLTVGPENPLDGVTLDRSELALSPGAKRVLTPRFSPTSATAQKLTWTSSNPSVAEVSQGVVTGRSPGQAVITLDADGYTAACQVSVYPWEVIAPPPLTLLAHAGPGEDTVRVEVVTTAPLSLSSLDLAMTWERGSLRLRDAVPGEAVGPVNFSANLEDGNALQGTISLQAQGEPADIGPGTVLAVYTFSPEASSPADGYDFTLGVLNAAEKDQRPLPWVGKRCGCSLPLTGQTITAGTLGTETAWSWAEETRTLTVLGRVTSAEPVLVAEYFASGQMRKVSHITEKGQTVTASAETAVIKLFRLGCDAVPLCPCSVIQLS